MICLLSKPRVEPIIFFVVIIVALLYFLIITYLDKCVKINSKVLKDLLDINESYDFYILKSHFDIKKTYDSKSSFNKIEPSYLMTAEIKNNIVWYAEYVSQMTKNREMNIQYIKQVEQIFVAENEVVYSKYKLINHLFYHREKILFERMKKHPNIDCCITVSMSYSSPKKRVNLQKNISYNFDDLVVCFNSISRSYLDKQTLKALHIVERGEVSDSLRYDIMLRDNFTCVLCGASAKQGAKLHVDHIVPVSKGGKSVPENLRTLCERCNMGKSDKTETVKESINITPNSSKLTCDICGGELVLRTGKFGKFYGCSNYPKCKFTKKFDQKDKD